jgi:hypothetical protein
MWRLLRVSEGKVELSFLSQERYKDLILCLLFTRWAKNWSDVRDYSDACCQKKTTTV